MEYMDLLVENVPRMLIVRGYRRDVVTLFTWPVTCLEIIGITEEGPADVDS
jgi:hypothetical protein